MLKKGGAGIIIGVIIGILIIGGIVGYFVFSGGGLSIGKPKTLSAMCDSIKISNVEIFPEGKFDEWNDYMYHVRFDMDKSKLPDDVYITGTSGGYAVSVDGGERLSIQDYMLTSGTDWGIIDLGVDAVINEQIEFAFYLTGRRGREESPGWCEKGPYSV